MVFATPARMIFKHCRYGYRLLQIFWICARYDALFWLPKDKLPWIVRLAASTARLVRRRSILRKGQRLGLALQAIGPTFIKLGQTLATRADLIGTELARDLSTLQDRLPPFPTQQAKAIIEEELGAPIAVLFSSFADKPIAAASIAQVYQAVTSDERAVAVKVVRPHLAEAFAQDVGLLTWLAGLIARKDPRYSRLKLPEVMTVLKQTIAMEMDLRMEAAAASEMAENLAQDAYMYVPAVDWQRTTKNVLTLEWVDGVRIDQRATLQDMGLDTDVLLAHAAQAFFRQVFQFGFFHADLHPGNLLVMNDGRLALLDFGVTGRLDKTTRLYLADMMHGFLIGDYHKVARAHFAAGYVPADQNEPLFAQACRAIGQPLLKLPLAEVSLAQLLGQLFETTERFNMATQPHLLLLQRTMVVAEGIGRALNPAVNMWELARPLVERWLVEHKSPLYRLRGEAHNIHDHVERLRKVFADMERIVQYHVGEISKEPTP